ncbi:MAG: hypothetical protein HWE39_10940 [Oceanospirillaceae bacterium]|nr:hypothetical protein [Oceanospirillaceae bacterium]
MNAPLNVRTQSTPPACAKTPVGAPKPEQRQARMLQAEQKPAEPPRYDFVGIAG